MKNKIFCLALVVLLIFSGCGSNQAETPTEVPTEAALAATEPVIPEEPVPLAAPVVTGDNSFLWGLVVVMAILGMAIINLTSKKNYAA